MNDILKSEEFLKISEDVFNFPTFPILWTSHCIMMSLTLRATLGDTNWKSYSRRHPLSLLILGVIYTFPGGILSAACLGQPILAFMAQPKLMGTMLVCWYLVFYSPFDIFAAIIQAFRLRICFGALQDFLRIQLVLSGVETILEAYPGSWLYPIVFGVIKSSGFMFVKYAEYILINGVDKAFIIPHHSSKTCILASLLITFQKTGVLDSSIELKSLFTLIVSVAVTLRLSTVITDADPYYPFESLFCAILFGNWEEAEVKKNETKELKIFPWKVYDGIFRSIFLHYLILYLFILIFSSNSLSPWQSIAILMSPHSWIYQILMNGCLFGYGFILTQSIRLEPYVPMNRISTVSSLLEAKTLSNLALSTLMGGVYVRSLVGTLGGSLDTFTIQCDVPGETTTKCLNFNHYFVVTSGMFCGFLFGWRMLFQNRNLIIFPPVNVSGPTIIKIKVFGMLKSSIRDCLLFLRWFPLVYFFLGHPLASSIAGVFRLENKFTLASIVSSGWNACFFNSVFIFVFKCTSEVHKIILAKTLNLDVEGQLLEAMDQKDSTLLKYLAFKELLEISRYSKQKRDILFKLSLPGGHPRNWNSLSASSLKCIEDFISHLSKSHTESVTFLPNSNNITKEFNSRKSINLGLRKRNNIGLEPNDDNDHASSNVSADEGKSFMKLLEMIWKNLQRNSLFSPFPDCFSRSTYAGSQLVIWSIEGLANLISCSVSEDEYGAIQKKLPEIVMTLINLQQYVERHKGLTTNLTCKNKYQIRDIQLKQELRSAIKTALYQICITYGDSLKEIGIGQEYLVKLESFRDFME